jgi:hypothetical protein
MSFLNRQEPRGFDVMSRIAAAMSVEAASDLVTDVQ